MHLDPTLDDVKKLATGCRRAARGERVLLHYNGHGVPRPTANGEVWVFNANYTQYVPLPLADVIAWAGSPAAYILDCSNAGACDAATAAAPREVPGLGSLMRSAALAPAPALALLGPWTVRARGGTMLVCLPAHAEALVACLDAVLPAMPHAVAQAGGLPPPRLRG
jgi:regulator-associated protein of mTOR